MADSPYALETKDLTIKFGGLTAVSEFNAAIEKGSIAGLIGPNGAGKTTCFNMITGFYQPTSGRVILNGQDITETKPHKVCQAGIARTFQNIRLFQNATALENVMLGAFIRQKTGWLQAVLNLPSYDREDKITRKHAMELLDTVGLADHAHDNAVSLPYGAQRRLEIARALATRPRFMVFDEATSALDVSVQAQIIGLMKDLQEKFNLTYLFISHDLSIMEHICHRVAVMYGGRIIEIQDARRLFTHPGHPYTRALKRAVPVADPGRRAPLGILEGEVPRLSHPPSGCYFHPRCPHAQPLCHTQYPPATSLGAQAWVHCHLPLTLEKESL